MRLPRPLAFAPAQPSPSCETAPGLRPFRMPTLAFTAEGHDGARHRPDLGRFEVTGTTASPAGQDQPDASFTGEITAPDPRPGARLYLDVAAIVRPAGWCRANPRSVTGERAPNHEAAKPRGSTRMVFETPPPAAPCRGDRAGDPRRDRPLPALGLGHSVRLGPRVGAEALRFTIPEASATSTTIAMPAPTFDIRPPPAADRYSLA